MAGKDLSIKNFCEKIDVSLDKKLESLLIVMIAESEKDENETAFQLRGTGKWGTRQKLNLLTSVCKMFGLEIEDPKTMLEAFTLHTLLEVMVKSYKEAIIEMEKSENKEKTNEQSDKETDDNSEKENGEKTDA